MNLQDDVNGLIIGGDYGMAWLTYEGRKQGRTIYPETELEAINKLDEMKAEFLSDENCGWLIYPNKNGWMYHLEGI